jgi:putative ABC transport system permease protein
MLTGPVQEGAVAVLGSLVVGVPVGMGLSVLAVRVLGLFFVLPPPLLAVSVPELIGFVALVAATSVLGFATALISAVRAQPAAVLREP